MTNISNKHTLKEINKINNGSGIDLQIGDYATTDFNGLNTITHVKIINRIDNFRSQSKSSISSYS